MRLLAHPVGSQAHRHLADVIAFLEEELAVSDSVLVPIPHVHTDTFDYPGITEWHVRRDVGCTWYIGYEATPDSFLSLASMCQELEVFAQQHKDGVQAILAVLQAIRGSALPREINPDFLIWYTDGVYTVSVGLGWGDADTNVMYDPRNLNADSDFVAEVASWVHRMADCLDPD